MGSKTGSRRLMEKAGVPVVPGTLRPAEGAGELKEFAEKAGYPVLLKASAGGGGKGMRRVDSDAELDAAFARVSSEAKSAFGDGAVYAEKLIERPRHIEVQVLGENGGRVTGGRRTRVLAAAAPPEGRRGVPVARRRRRAAAAGSSTPRSPPRAPSTTSRAAPSSSSSRRTVRSTSSR
jgi:hypothetical protein